MRNKILIALVALLSLSCYAQEEDKTQKRYFEINKNIDIFNNVLRELDMSYVDTLDVSKTVRTGIDYMLNSFDPYTVYYDDEDMKDFKLMITGEYAGVGSTIVFRDSLVCISDPMQNQPAAKAGLKAGDYILQINGKDMTKCEKKEGESYGQTLSSYVSSHLKGEPGTTIQVTVKREGHKKPLTISVTREIVTVDIIPYYGVIRDSVGYINLTTFTDKSAMKTKEAFKDLKKQGITSLVFDLRQNGGGSMEDAIEIVNMFVPKGKKVVSTKGKTKYSDRTHITTLEPIDANIPIAVLIDKGSASASEIVAGSLQDLDRAILVGERTFGKGLVQTTKEIPYGGTIKVTIAKYYIPSGRCVQAIDYSHRNDDGSVGRTPDSLTTVFYTEVGRPVRDGGGVTPDIEVKAEKQPNITFYLNNQFIVFDWVTKWVGQHETIGKPEKFSITSDDYDNFKTLVKSKDFQYDRISEKSMKSLKEVMEFEGYMETAESEFKALEAKLVPDLDRDLDLFKEQIIKQINSEIIKRYYYQNGELRFALQSDEVLNKAIETLKDNDLYKNTLSVQPEKSEEKKEEIINNKDEK